MWTEDILDKKLTNPSRKLIEDIIRIEGDPDSPLNRGTICAKGLAQIERLDHPDRLIYPMKRMGQKGEGKWKRISWDEALDIIAGKIRETIKQEGEKAISFAQGTPKGLELFLMIRLANVLNIPNIATRECLPHAEGNCLQPHLWFFPNPRLQWQSCLCHGLGE
jgi:anaerobic selenocysteine-containing dehydrogenase